MPNEHELPRPVRASSMISFLLQWIAVLLATALLAACGDGEEGGPPAHGGPGGAMPPAAVTVVTVEPETIPATFEYVGQTAGSREVEVRARVSGILLKRNYREGAPVERGQSMYQIDPASFRAALDRAEADVAAANARLAQATRTLARLKPLYADRAVSQKEHDDAASSEQIARADLQSARARAAEARLNLGYTRVEAPIGGLAGRSLVSEGTLVAGPQTLLTSITQIDPIFVRFGLPDTDQLRWRHEMQAGRLVLPKSFGVELTLSDGTSLQRKGRLQFTDWRVSSATGTTEAQAEVPNSDGALRPGQFVRVRLVGATRPNAVRVPTRAVLEGPQGKFVYVVADGKAQARPVTAGEQLGDQWLVTEGLKAGDSVIVDGVMRIGPGAPVQATAPAASAVAAAPASSSAGAASAAATASSPRSTSAPAGGSDTAPR